MESIHPSENPHRMNGVRLLLGRGGLAEYLIILKLNPRSMLNEYLSLGTRDSEKPLFGQEHPMAGLH